MIIQEKECKHCGKMFAPTGKRPNLQLYCSPQCKSLEDSSRIFRHKYICANCGKEIFRSYKIKSKQPFCDQECYSAYKHALCFENRKCEFCGHDFECSKLSTKRFCCPECQVGWQRANPVCGENHPSYNHDISIEDRTLVCQYCGKKYLVKPYEISVSKYCSRECKHNGMLDAARYTKTWEERIDTIPQRITNQLLDELQISYTNEYRCGYFSIDNYCDQLNLPIEVMGTYWHADIRSYPDEISELQKRDIVQDKRKHTFVLNHLNAEILYLWEYDLHNNLEVCEQLVKDYIQNNGKLLNYHSYNYHLEGGVLTINDTLMYGYMETKNDYHSLVSQ